MPKPVYDDEKAENNSGQLGNPAGSSESGDSNRPSFGRKSSTPDSRENNAVDGNSETPSDRDKSSNTDTSSNLSPSDIQDREEGAQNTNSPTRGDQTEQDSLDGGGFYNSGSKDNKSKAGGFFKRNRKKLIGGGAVGGGIVGIIASFMLILPLKVQHMVNNLQQNFFASSEQATEDMTEHLFRSYIVKKVVPGMVGSKTCTSTLTNRGCVSVTPGDSPVATLYNAWKDKRFEQRLAERGIIIEKRGQGGNNFRLITPSTLDQDGVDLGTFNPNNPDAFEARFKDRLDRGEVRSEVRKSFESETFAKRIFYRYKVGRFMEKKYGVVRCLVACNFRDSTRSKIEDKKLAWKTRFVDRVIMPRSEMYGNAFLCAMEAFKCTDVPEEAKKDGTRETEFEETSRAAVTKRNSRDVDISDPETLALAEDIRQNGIRGHMISNMQNKMLAYMASGVSKSIPWVGYVIIASELFKGLEEAGPAAKHLNYVINSQAMVTTYMMYRTHADEIKTGKLDSTLVGSVGESLGSNNGTDQNGGPAESSPYYSEFMNGKIKKGGLVALLNPLTAKAYAAEGYKCNEEGVTISKGVCPELDLSTSTAATKFAGGLSNVLKTPPFSLLGDAAGAFTTLAGLIDKALNAVGVDALISQLAKLIPQALIDFGKKLADPIVEWFVGQFINDAVGDRPSGGRMFDLMAGGADVSGNTYAHYGLGGKVIGTKAAEDIRTAREQERLEEFEQKSFFARAFDTSSKYSLVSQAAVSMPSSSAGFAQSIFSNLLSPFSAISNIPVGSSHSATAASYQADLFGIVQYGYPASHPVFTTDPQKYWDDNNCADPDQVKKWGEQGVVNEDTGIPENTEANGCLLLDASVSMAGGYFSDELLTPEEVGDPTSDETGTDQTSLNTLKMGTYNVFNYDLAGPTRGYDPSDDARIRGIAKLIEDKGLNIVAIQEADGLVRGKLLEYLPKNYSATEPTGGGGDLIIWDSTLFKQTDFRKFMIPKRGLGNRNPGNEREAIRVKLQSKETNESLYVFGVHLDTDVEGRRIGANIVVDELKTLGDEPVIVAGDMNSNYSSPNRDEAYRVFNAYGKITITSQATNNRSGYNCDTHNGFDGRQDCRNGTGSHLDQVWVTKNADIKVEKWENVANQLTVTLSDHNPVIANIAIPGISGASDAVGSTEMGDDYAKECGPMKASGAPGLACDNQCVDFVKFRLKKHIDKNDFASLGNGKDVVATLGGKGYVVNKKPAVNSVVSWPAGGVAGSSANATYGHTAMVSKVNGDGSIVVEEYNYVGGAYSTRKIPKSVVENLTFAHTEKDFK